MRFNTSEIDSIKPMEEGDYYKEPTFSETFSAQIQSIKSVGLETSEGNYFNDEMKIELDEWKKADSINEKLYDRISRVPRSDLERMEDWYASGKIDRIKNTHSLSNDGMVGIGSMNIGESFLEFKALQEQYGFNGPSEIMQRAKDKSLEDFTEAQTTLQRSDRWGAKLAGGVAGYAHSPTMLATLPLGTFTAGSGVLMNSIRAAGQEMTIEAMAQSLTAPQVHSYKNEIGIRTSIADTATEVMLNIGTAGLIRGAGSAAYDLTEKGVQALRKSNPDLANDYEATFNRNISSSNEEHLDNIERVENGEPLHFSEETEQIKKVMDEGEQKMLVDIERPVVEDLGKEDVLIVTGKTPDGEIQTRSYNDIIDEVDETDSYLKIVEDCLLGNR